MVRLPGASHDAGRPLYSYSACTVRGAAVISSLGATPPCEARCQPMETRLSVTHSARVRQSRLDAFSTGEGHVRNGTFTVGFRGGVSGEGKYLDVSDWQRRHHRLINLGSAFLLCPA